MVNPIFWLIGLAVFGVEFAREMANPDNPAPPDKDKPPRKSRDWLSAIQGAIAKNLAQKTASLVKMFLRMKVIDVPVEVTVNKLTPEKICCPEGFAVHEKEFNKDNIWKNFSSPETANYKFVAFPGVAGLLELLLIALTKRWGIATQEELRAIESQCQVKDLGLGDAFHVMTLGTVVKRKSIKHSYCSPVVTFRPNVVTREKEKLLTLHDLLFDPIYPGTYILFRTKAKKK